MTAAVREPQRRARRRRPAAAPGQRAPSSGASGVTQSKRDLVAREEAAQSPQAGSQRWPTIVTRGFGGSAAMPCSPPMRSRASALTLRGDLRRRRRERVVLPGLDPHHARRLGGAVAARETACRA